MVSGFIQIRVDKNFLVCIHQFTFIHSPLVRYLGWSPFSAVVYYTALSTAACAFLSDADSHSLRHTPSIALIRSYGSCIFRILRNHDIIFFNAYIIFVPSNHVDIFYFFLASVTFKCMYFVGDCHFNWGKINSTSNLSLSFHDGKGCGSLLLLSLVISTRSVSLAHEWFVYVD